MSVGPRSGAGRLLLAIVVALACVAVAALPAWAGAKGGGHKDALTIESLRVGTKVGPVVVRVKARPTARVSIEVDGKRVRHDFEFAGNRAQQIELRRADGLVPGANRLLIRSVQHGHTLTAHRTVKLSRVVLMADAGEDMSATRRSRAQVGTAPTMMGADAPEYHWSVVGHPPGVTVALHGKHDPRPVLHANHPGTYALQLELDPPGPGPVSYDQTMVTVAPEDPPVGVYIDTINPQHGIAIGKDVYGASGGGARTAYVVLQRTTREPVLGGDGKPLAGSVANDAAGLAQLNALAKTYGDGRNFMNYLMIVSGEKMPEAVLGDFGRLAKQLGAALPSEEDFASLRAGHQYSIVGIPGAPEEAATVRIPDMMVGSTSSGGITGFLQALQAVNVDGAPVYSYASPEYISFDTRAASSATAVTMRVGVQSVQGSLPSGATAGFFVVAVDPFTGKIIGQRTIPTNGSTGSDRQRQNEAATVLAAELASNPTAGADGPPKPLFFVQAIGKPKAAGPEWGNVVAQLARLGANPVLVNALDGTTEYALVSHLDSRRPPLEASTAYDPGPYGDPHYPAARLVGSLARSRNYRFEPTVSSTPTSENPDGMVNLGLIALAYQPPRDFPVLGADSKTPPKPGEGAAIEHYICTQLGFCQGANSCPTLRACYWQRYGSAAWTQVYAELSRLKPPADQSFQPDVFDAVQNQLLTEVGALAVDRQWLTDMQRPLEDSQQRGLLDLNDISQKIWNGLQKQPKSAATSFALGLISKFLLLGGFAAKPYSSMAAGVSAIFGIGAYLSTPTGQPILGAEVKAQASQLGNELVDRLNQARQTSFVVGKLVASDYGKLIDLRNHVKGDWALGENPKSTTLPLETAAKQWFYEALVPVAYPYLVRGNKNARDIRCELAGAMLPAFGAEPDSAQMWVTVGYDGNGNPIKNIFFFVRGFAADPPPDSLGQAMFKPRRADGSGGLGMEKLNFFTPRVFGGKIFHAVDTGHRCELGLMYNE